MSDHKCASGLLNAADEDIRALRALLGTDFGDSVFGFHVQQAAEKSFKAWLALLDVRFPLTHDLGVLMGLLQRTVDAAAFTPLRVYAPFAVQFRYQARYQAVEREPPIDRQTALQQAEALWRRVTQELERIAPRGETPSV